jgi:hypothetical protein
MARSCIRYLPATNFAENVINTLPDCWSALKKLKEGQIIQPKELVTLVTVGDSG